MEKQTLPNSTLVLVFGILSLLGCCCYGVLGLIFAIVALVLAKRATNLYKEQPELYTGYSNVKTGKILAWIGLIVSALYLIGLLVFFSIYGIEEVQAMQEEWIRQYGGETTDF